MKTYEYEIEAVDASSIKQTLSDRGIEGWELVSVQKIQTKYRDIDPSELPLPGISAMSRKNKAETIFYLFLKRENFDI